MKTILIIDDEVLLLELISEMLDSYNCVTANHLRQAHKILESKAIDVILCDVVMPGGGGIELYYKLINENSPLSQRMIFITGGSTSRESQEFLEMIDLPVIYKPFREDDVLRAVERLDER